MERARERIAQIRLNADKASLRADEAEVATKKLKEDLAVKEELLKGAEYKVVRLDEELDKEIDKRKSAEKKFRDAELKAEQLEKQLKKIEVDYEKLEKKYEESEKRYKSAQKEFDDLVASL
ncbi:hypothetical protein ABKN59_011915 [Abortiporus biennis]